MWEKLRLQLAEVVDESAIEPWLQTPNKSFDGRKPQDLIDNEEYEPLKSMIYLLRSGEPLS